MAIASSYTTTEEHHYLEHRRQRMSQRQDKHHRLDFCSSYADRQWFLVPLDVAVACCSCSCASCLCTVPQHPLACKSQIYRSTADLL